MASIRSITLMQTLLAAAIVLGAVMWTTPLRAEDCECRGEREQEYPNLIAGFLGFTGKGRRENGLAVGVEYARRFPGRFSVGALYEHTFGDVDVDVVAFPLAYQVEQIKLYAAPGAEDFETFLVRIGIEWVLEYERFEVAPQIDYDIISGENAVVMGITYGYKF